MVTVHEVASRAESKGSSAPGREIYFPLGGADIYGKDEPPFGLEGASAQLSPDGSILLTASFKTVRLWNIAKGVQGRPTALTLEHSGNVQCIFTPDSKQLLSFALVGGKTRTSKAQYEVRLWDAKSGEPVGEVVSGIMPGIAGSLPVVKLLHWTPDAKGFVTACAGQNREAESVQFWDVKTLQPVGEPLTARGDVCYFGRDGTTLLIISKTEIVLWDLPNRKTLGKLSTPGIAKKAVGTSLANLAKSSPLYAIHPRGTSILYREGDLVQLWDLSKENPTEKLTLKHSGQVYWLAISQDGKRAVTACEGQDEVLVWNLETGKPILKIPHNGKVKAMEFSPDG